MNFQNLLIFFKTKHYNLWFFFKNFMAWYQLIYFILKKINFFKFDFIIFLIIIYSYDLIFTYRVNCFNIKYVEYNYLNKYLINNYPVLFYGDLSFSECNYIIKYICNINFHNLNYNICKYNLKNKIKLHYTHPLSHLHLCISDFSNSNMYVNLQMTRHNFNNFYKISNESIIGLKP